MDYAAYVLTVPRLADRLAAFRAAWRGLPVEPVIGVDYLDYDDHHGQARYYFHLASAIGHLRMYRRAETVGAEWSLFLEDGSTPQVPLGELARLLNAARSCFSWDVLRLDAIAKMAMPIGWLDRRRLYQLAVPSQQNGAGAYLVPRRMLGPLQRTRWLCPADVHLAHCGRNLSIYPPPVDHGPSTFPSAAGEVVVSAAGEGRQQTTPR